MPAHGKRRALGQHFLKDTSVCELIVRTAFEECRKTPCHTLLEIGPGRGALTHLILQTLSSENSEGIRKFIVSERDAQLALDWKSYPHSEDFLKKVAVQVEEGDFLDLDESRWLKNPPIGVVSNLPYSAGTAMLTRMARHPQVIPFMVLMFQAEVAHRLRAQPNTKSWGSLSLWIQNRWDVTPLCAVPPRAFAPPPDVNSEVVVLRRRETPRIPDEGPLWESLLKACFAHRRKMLRSGLSSSTLFRNALDRAAIDGTKRAESLTWDEWLRFYQAATELAKGTSFNP
jgi:16S rRNA (adenine1518-N6/adenine1519-N6)-dimethyltransferase